MRYLIDTDKGTCEPYKASSGSVEEFVNFVSKFASSDGDEWLAETIQKYEKSYNEALLHREN